MTINSAIFVVSNTDFRRCPEDDFAEFAFVGRSNVGKSSLINYLVGKKDLAKTSSTPGKTLLINHFLVNEKLYIVDLPGYGYAKVSKMQREKLRKIIENYVLFRSQLTNLFVLIDSRLEPQKIDLDFINWLGKNSAPFSIVFTKGDKQSQKKLTTNIEKYRQTLLETWEELPPIFITSSEKKQGKEEILDYIDTIMNGELNA
ncbi:MAG: ribosome biogenesis GTP-binding protein YihA/YsxC [Prevotellaceae bacterium]|jgi:GTP-binding protein|nr:ribosome biogenesis GTP-binding protein YihA/YsxC [Prevotellaceae bacterium]